MNRALPLLLLAAAAAVGLGYFALQTGRAGSRPAGDGVVDDASRLPADPSPRTTSDTSVGAELAAVPLDRTFVPPAEGSLALSWEIIPMNLVGQPIADAQITATRGTEERTAVGRTKWESVPAGQWTIVVESDGNPTWRREFVLEPNRSTKTPVRLGDEIWVEGTLVDTNDKKVGAVPVFLLPPGVGHPSRTQMARDRGNPRAPAMATNGAITAETISGGRFKAKLPKAGEWRVSVGTPGEARWTQRRGTELTYGGPERAEVTIPALARVRFEFSGREEDRPTQVSAYRFDAAYARLVEEGRSTGVSDDGSSVQEAQRMAKERLLKQSAMKGGGKGLGYGGETRGARSGTARTSREEMSESVVDVGDSGAAPVNYSANRGQLFEPGWRMVKSARVDARGQALVVDLPTDTDLRFLFVRGTERITTAASYKVPQGKLSIGRTTLPPAGTAPDDGPDNRASVSLGLAPDDEEIELSPGVIWGF